ncbi:serine protease [Streptomyces sp. NPDC052687]|uniref:trypsin-like serine peptidase n=1 Tax=Streptomyces sp. NPDC052687 TaxID=3154759 RepID=UPI003442E466
MAAGGGVGAASSTRTPSWAVRIRGADGKIMGAGVLLSPDRVLTCAHVVEQAADRITAEFVAAAGPGNGAVPAAEAHVEALVPNVVDADGEFSGDLALLRLARPRPKEAPTRLHRLSASDRQVRMYGFPAGYDGGVWFRATAVGGTGRDGLVQLAPATPGEVATRGCSGAGVVDILTGEVIGIILNRKVDRNGNRFSYMSPAETIVRYLPGVHRWTEGPTAVDAALRSTADDTSEALLDEPFAQRLTAWLRGDDARQVKISVVRHDEAARDATLRRTITLADRELRTPVSVDRASLDPPDTVPSAGGHDLALDATRKTTAEIAERIAERMGLRNPPERPAVDRIKDAKVTVSLVVFGVDEARDPRALLDLLDVLRSGGSRLLLVFRTAGDWHDEACRRLVTEPALERRARLVERLREITGPLARALHERRATVVPYGVRPFDADLVAAHAALADLTHGRTHGRDDPPHGPDLGGYERLAERVAARLAGTVARLDRLIDRREELRGRLRSYHVLHQRTTHGKEDPAVDALYLRAHELLQSRPCDIRAAEAAVRAYTRRVEQPHRGEEFSS